MADDNLRTAVSPTEADNSASNPFYHVLSDGTNPLSVTGGVLDVNASVTLETAFQDDAASFTLGTSKANAQGFIVDDTATDTVAEGSFGIARMTTNRIMLATIADDDGDRLAIDASGRLTSLISDGTDTLGINTDGSIQIGDGTETLLINTDGSISTQITDGTDDLAINADGSINVVTSDVAGTRIHDHDASAATAKDATSNHDYTVANTTFLLNKVSIAGAGRMKAEVQTGPVASLVSRLVLFKEREATVDHEFVPAIAVPSTSTGTVRIIRTQRSLGSLFMYSTIEGDDQ